MASRSYLVREILKELGVWQTGQDLPPEDFRVVDEALPFKIEAMAKARVFAVDDLDSDVPDEAVSELARYLANEYAQVFGISEAELAKVQQNASLAEIALRFQRTRTPTYARMRADYF
jgi:hypothetical protein